VTSLGNWSHFDTNLRGASFYPFSKTIYKNSRLPLRFLSSDLCLADFLRVKLYVVKISPFPGFAREKNRGTRKEEGASIKL